MRAALFATAIAFALTAAPAQARVHEQSDRGFVVRVGVDVPASPEQAWSTLVRPSQWWDEAHTYSRDARNLSLEVRAGGCFCEVLPSESSPKAAPRGSVEHMRVIYAENPRALRMSGALGPLQSDAATGTLTIFLKPLEGGTRILWEYVVSRYASDAKMPGAVDQVLTGQILRLAKALGAKPKSGGEGVPSDQVPADAADPFADAFTSEPAEPDQGGIGSRSAPEPEAGR